jgi:hypothetical protein
MRSRAIAEDIQRKEVITVKAIYRPFKGSQAYEWQVFFLIVSLLYPKSNMQPCRTRYKLMVTKDLSWIREAKMEVGHMLLGLLYPRVISLICKLIIFCGNMRTWGHGNMPYMQGRVIGSIEKALPGYRKHFRIGDDE